MIHQWRHGHVTVNKSTDWFLTVKLYRHFQTLWDSLRFFSVRFRLLSSHRTVDGHPPPLGTLVHIFSDSLATLRSCWNWKLIDDVDPLWKINKNRLNNHSNLIALLWWSSLHSFRGLSSYRRISPYRPNRVDLLEILFFSTFYSFFFPYSLSMAFYLVLFCLHLSFIELQFDYLFWIVSICVWLSFIELQICCLLSRLYFIARLLLSIFIGWSSYKSFVIIIIHSFGILLVNFITCYDRILILSLSLLVAFTEKNVKRYVDTVKAENWNGIIFRLIEHDICLWNGSSSSSSPSSSSCPSSLLFLNAAVISFCFLRQTIAANWKVILPISVILLAPFDCSFSSSF